MRSFSLHDGQHASKGFALIVALAMMALVVLVILATALPTRVDTAGMVTVRSQTEARQNALTGLNRALGALQTYAGPDQRTSARAEILGTSVQQPYWTGIWNSAPQAAGSPFEQGTEPVWLVSSESTPDPVNGPAPARAVELVRSSSGGNESVSVEKVALPATDRSSPGEFAYWVGDEGVKVNISMAEPESFPGINQATVAQLRRLNGAHHAAWEVLAGGSARVSSNDAAKLDSRQALSLLSGFSLNGHFHDLTAHSVSLLTNAKDGGIKEDLSRILRSGFSENNAYVDNAPLLPAAAAPMNTPTWGLLRSFHQFGLDAATSGQLNPSVAVRPQSATEHGVFPLIAMVQMNWHARWVPSEDPATPPTKVTFAAQPVITLVNPYNVSLASATYIIRIRYTSAKLILGTGSVDAPTLKAEIDVRTSFDTVSPQQNMIMFRTSAVAFAPGESKVLSLAPTAGDVHYVPDLPATSRILLSPGLNLVHSMTVGQPQDFPLPAGQNPWLRLENGAVLVQLYRGNQVHYIDDIYYATTHRASYNLNAPDYIPNRMILRSSARNIIARGGTPYRKDHNSGARWLAHYNLRVPSSRRDPDGAWISNPLFQGFWDDVSEPESYSIAVSGDNTFWGESSDSGQTHNVLFDIPRQPLISLGSLQHANLSPETWYPAYPFANSWASPYFAHDARDFSYQLNEAFWDRYFFSGLPDGITEWPNRDDWYNPRLFPLAPMPQSSDGSGSLPGYQELGAYLGIRGGFNINSTSTAAWSAMLRSLQGMAVPFVDPVAGNSGAVATGTGTPILRNSVANGPAGELWRGFRVLTPEQIDRLAEAIVGVIREKGPFRTLAEFVNRDLRAPKGSDFNLRGPLQVAIDRSGINVSASDPNAPWNADPQVPTPANRVQEGDDIVNLTYPEASTGPRSTAAPGFVTQGDLLTVLGPAISARSDTFVIRAYGNTLNRANGQVEAEVWCEAVVQRFPEYVDPSEAPHAVPALSENVKFGRRFRIVSFRWLSPDEL